MPCPITATFRLGPSNKCYQQPGLADPDERINFMVRPERAWRHLVQVHFWQSNGACRLDYERVSDEHVDVQGVEPHGFSSWQPSRVPGTVHDVRRALAALLLPSLALHHIPLAQAAGLITIYHDIPALPVPATVTDYPQDFPRSWHRGHLYSKKHIPSPLCGCNIAHNGRTHSYSW